MKYNERYDTIESTDDYNTNESTQSNPNPNPNPIENQSTNNSYTAILKKCDKHLQYSYQPVNPEDFFIINTLKTKSQFNPDTNSIAQAQSLNDELITWEKNLNDSIVDEVNYEIKSPKPLAHSNNNTNVNYGEVIINDKPPEPELESKPQIKGKKSDNLSSSTEPSQINTPLKKTINRIDYNIVKESLQKNKSEEKTNKVTVSCNDNNLYQPYKKEIQVSNDIPFQYGLILKQETINSFETNQENQHNNIVDG